MNTVNSVFVYTITMRITFDPAKRDRTWREKGLDFADAAVVFAGVTLEVEDTRQAYGETRTFVLACWLAGWWWWATHRVVRIAMCSA